MELLETPVVASEFRGEPIEQLGVRGSDTERAEVAGGGSQSAAEVVHPDAVDDHSSHQRMLAVGQSSCPGQSTPGRWDRGVVFRQLDLGIGGDGQDREV